MLLRIRFDAITATLPALLLQIGKYFDSLICYICCLLVNCQHCDHCRTVRNRLRRYSGVVDDEFSSLLPPLQLSALPMHCWWLGGIDCVVAAVMHI